MNNLIKVNLACGNIFSDNNWINVDYSPIARFRKFGWFFLLASKLGIVSYDIYKYNFIDAKWPKNILFCNLKGKLPFDDNSCDIVYCSHFLEHLTPLEGDKFLKEIYRILKKDGLLRLVVPNLEFEVNEYLNSNSIDKGNRLNSLFYRLNSWELEGIKMTYIMKKFSGPNEHKWNYDFSLLNKKLLNNGFIKIIKCNNKTGECPDIYTLDNHRDESNLIIEAKK